MSVIDEQPQDEVSEFMKDLDADGVYLSGPIRCVADNGTEWREELIEDFPEIDFNNPLDNYSPETHDILSDPENFVEDAERTQVLPSEYVVEDKIMISKSDAFFLGLPEAIARGSMMETMFAVRMNIPVFVWTIDGQTESGWIYDHAQFMSDDRNEVMKQLKDYLREENNE